MKRKLISLLLAAAMVLSLYPSLNLQAEAEETTAYDIVHTMDSGKIYFNSQTGTIVDAELSGEVEIPAQIQGHAVLVIGHSAFSNSNGQNPITSITLPEGLVTLEAYALSNSNKLQKIHLPNSLREIGVGCFYNSFIQEVIVPEGVKTIGAEAFSRCGSLKKAVLPDSLVNMGEYVFLNCTWLDSVKLPKNMTRIENSTFKGCEKLGSIELPASLTEIGENAFNGCKKLGSIEFPASLTEIGENAFSGCKTLKEALLPEGLVSLGSGAFYQCEALERVELPEALTVIGHYAFQNCKALPEITLPSGLLEIGAGAFASCNQFTHITLPEGLKVIGDRAFNNCDRLTGIDLPDSLEKLGSAAFGDSKEITVYENGEYLDGWYVGTKHSFPSTRVVRIKEGTVGVATDAVRLPYPYEDDSHWDIDTLYIPKSLLYIYRDAFRDINDMDCIIVDPDNPAYSSQDNILYNKDKTELIFCGRYVWLANVTFPQSLKRIGDRAFACCKYLTSISLPEGVESIGEKAFHSSTLQEIHIGSALQFIGSKAFHSCSKLERVYFAGDAPEIGEEAFHNCPKLVLYCGESAEGWTYPTWNEYPTVMLKDSELAASAFTDVPTDAYYADAVGWAVANSITNGTGNRKFEPESDCLRSQVVTFLWRAAGCQEPKVQENPFADVYDFSYFYKPVLWAVDAKITTGTHEGYFSPDQFCTRAQVVTFLWRLQGEPKAESTKNPFVDVAADTYYYEAVLWALEEGITTGTSATEFSPDETCTRAQIVTFLYRAFQ